MENSLVEFEEILLSHIKRYPKMQPRDCAKLIFQCEFAGEHMIASATKSLDRIKQELEETPSGGELYEPIGNGLVRLHLGGAKEKGMRPEEINHLFLSSAGQAPGSREGQADKLMLLERLCQEGKTPFAPAELEAFLTEYRREGCPSLHHSQQYRAAYRPHYRVVKI